MSENKKKLLLGLGLHQFTFNFFCTPLNISNSRPYTFKLTVHTMGKLEKAIYFMCQNFSSKVDWVNRLEEVIKSSPANLAPIKTESSVTRAVVASLPPPEEVNKTQGNFSKNRWPFTTD